MVDAVIMTLDQWMTDASLSAESVGKKMNLSGQAIRRYRSGERMPDAQTIEAIKALSGGLVDVRDFHDAHLKFISAHKEA